MIKSIQFHLEKYKCQRIVNHYLKQGKPRIYHYHIMKTGGTSINSAFFSLSGKDSYEVRRSIINHPERYFRSEEHVFSRGKWLIESGLFTYGFSHFPKWQVNVPADTFTFTCLRDPLKRLISRYRHLQMMYQSSYRAKFEADRAAFVDSLQDDFLSFVQQTSIEQRHHMLYMFSEQLDPYEAFEQLKKLDIFIFLEELKEGMSLLEERTGFSLPMRWANKSSYQEEITEEAKEEAKARYLKNDYIFFELARDYYAERFKHQHS